MKRNQTLALMVFVLLLASALRFHRLEVQSFWNDEGNSARLSERSLDLIIDGTASDIHPPLYYLLLRGWREVAGDSEFGLRSFSAFVGIGVVALTFSQGRLLLGPAGKKAIITAALLAAINPALVYYSQETRMYELLAFLAVLSTWLFVRLLQRPGWSIAIAAAYIVTATAGLYTHYFFPAVLLAQNLIFLIWLYLRNRSEGKRTESNFLEDAGRWVFIMLAVLVLYLPWAPIFLRQAVGRAGDRAPMLPFLTESGKWMAFGPTIELDEVMIPLAAYFLLLFLGIYLGRKRTRWGIPFSATLVLLLAIPVAIMWLAGSNQPAFFKFLLVAIPPLCLLSGPGLSWLYSRTGNNSFDIIQTIGALLLGLLILWGSARSLYNIYYEPDYARADYRSIAAQIAAEAHPNAAVILNAANQWEVFTYYHTEGAPVFPVPRGYPDPAVIDDELRGIADQVDRIYAIYWGEGLRDPNRLVERWLNENAFKAREEWISDVRFITYGVPAEVAKDMETSTSLPFGEHIELQGYILDSNRAVPGEILHLQLFWQTGEELKDRYKVFLHLVDEDGQIIAQRDSEPGGGLAITNTWPPGEMIVDSHGLMIPLGTQPGMYRLLLGLYDVTNPAARLPIELDGAAVDAFTVASITVRDR